MQRLLQGLQLFSRLSPSPALPSSPAPADQNYSFWVPLNECVCVAVTAVCCQAARLWPCLGLYASAYPQLSFEVLGSHKSSVLSLGAKLLYEIVTCWPRGHLIVSFGSYCLSKSSALYMQVWVQKKAVGEHHHLERLLHLTRDWCGPIFLWIKFIGILVLPLGMASKSLVGLFMLWDGRA